MKWAGGAVITYLLLLAAASFGSSRNLVRSDELQYNYSKLQAAFQLQYSSKSLLVALVYGVVHNNRSAMLFSVVEAQGE